jgi:nucleobase transporter 1/2
MNNQIFKYFFFDVEHLFSREACYSCSRCFGKCAGKIGAFIASIPQVIVAALLCVMWSMLSAFGLSNLRYSETGSSRNVIIVGLSLFLSLSVPAYFQHYTSGSIPATVASYFQPYTVVAHGPVKTGFEAVYFYLHT